MVFGRIFYHRLGARQKDTQFPSDHFGWKSGCCQQLPPQSRPGAGKAVKSQPLKHVNVTQKAPKGSRFPQRWLLIGEFGSRNLSLVLFLLLVSIAVRNMIPVDIGSLSNLYITLSSTLACYGLFSDPRKSSKIQADSKMQKDGFPGDNNQWPMTNLETYPHILMTGYLRMATEGEIPWMFHQMSLLGAKTEPMNCSIWSVMACNSIMFFESGWEASKIIPERLFARVATAGDFTVPSMCLWQLCRVAFVRSRAQNGSISYGEWWKGCWG